MNTLVIMFTVFVFAIFIAPLILVGFLFVYNPNFNKLDNIKKEEEVRVEDISDTQYDTHENLKKLK